MEPQPHLRLQTFVAEAVNALIHKIYKLRLDYQARHHDHLNLDVLSLLQLLLRAQDSMVLLEEFLSLLSCNDDNLKTDMLLDFF
jgi:hypothetical protein